jgi:hypothetical protein
MSFWHCLTILLQANNLVFPDEKQAEEHFLAKYGEAAQLIGLEKEEDAQASPSKKLELQLAEAAKILGTQVLLDQEAIEDGTIPAPKRFNVGASRVVRVQWASSAQVAFKTAAQSSPLQGVWKKRANPTQIEVSLDTLDLLGWDQLLKLLFRAKGKTEQTLLDFVGELEVEQLNTETLTSERATELEALKMMAQESLFRYTDSQMFATKVPPALPSNSSLLSVPDVVQSNVALPTTGDVQASESMTLSTSTMIASSLEARADSNKTLLPSSASASEAFDHSSNSQDKKTHNKVEEYKLKEIEQKVFSLESLMALKNTGSFVQSFTQLQIPVLKSCSLQAIRTYAVEINNQIQKAGPASTSVHPMQGIHKDALSLLKLVWNGSDNTSKLGPFEDSRRIPSTTWLREVEEAVRLIEKAPKAKAELLFLEKKDGRPQIMSFITYLTEYFEHHGKDLSLEKKIDVILKGIRRSYKKMANYIEDTIIPRARREEDENNKLSVDKILFLVLSEFRSAAQFIDNDKSESDSDDERPGKATRQIKKKTPFAGDKSKVQWKPKAEAPIKQKIGEEKNLGEESGKKRERERPEKKEVSCWICKKPGHTKKECPEYKPPTKKTRFGMLAAANKYRKELLPTSWFTGNFKLQPKEDKKDPMEGVCAFDTMAEDFNYCSLEFVQMAESLGYIATPNDLQVCLADGKTVVPCSKSISVPITLCFDMIGRRNKEVVCDFFVIPNHSYMLTFGAPDIVKHDILPDMLALISTRIKLSEDCTMLGGVKGGKPSLASAITAAGGGATKSINQSTSLSEVKQSTVEKLDSSPGSNRGSEMDGASLPPRRAAETVIATENSSVTLEATTGGFVLKAPPGEEDDIEVQAVIPDSFGDAKFEKISWSGVKNDIAHEVVNTLKTFCDIFSETVDREPCKMEKYRIQLKKGVEFPPREMRQQVRPQTPRNKIAIEEKLKKWEELGIVKRVTSKYWSQVHVVNKENKAPRICIDWRALNSLVEIFQFPIPDIKRTLAKLNNHKLYGTIDLTDAYQQVAMHPDSIEFTAFRTDEAIFVMNRLGFGHSGAVAHFQKEMALSVLDNLIGKICFVYLDDIIWWGDTTAEFLQNLCSVLERLRKYKIKAKASKIKIGTSLVFLGHVIDRMGMAMSDDRKAALMSIQLPSTVRELHVFLGTANYFRDFIQGHSSYTTRLTRMLQPNLRAKLEWTPETTADFESLKKKIVEAPMLWWLQDGLKTGISTDASQFCWGGYLWQIKDNKERVILFCSGSFSGSQLNWPIGEKEMFAVVAVVEKVKYLIGTTLFTIKTDHRNLQFFSAPSKSARVERYKLYLSRFAHIFEVIPGESNTIADGLTRLMGLRLSLLCGISEVNTKRIRTFHGGLAGHRGIEATLSKMREAGHKWSTMRSDVTMFIQSCPICQVVKTGPGKRGIAQTFELVATAENQSIAMDTLGPLDQDADGFQYIIALVDEFSRYTELYAAKAATSSEAAQAILEYCCRWGIPETFKSDRGSQYNSGLISALTSQLGSKLNLIPVGSSEENGICERKFRDVRADLGALVRENPSVPWSKLIKIVERVINSSVNTLTKVAPADLRLGKRQALDTNLLFAAAPVVQSEGVLPKPALAKEHQAKLAEVYEALASSVLDNISKHQATKETTRIQSPTIYSQGSWAFLEEVHPRKGDPAATKRLGPYQVLHQEGNTVTLSVNEREKIVPVTSCVAFVPGQVEPQRLQAENSTKALENTRYYVEEVISHRVEGKKPSLTNTVVEVKWVGYPESTFERLSENSDIRQTEAFLRYTNVHNELLRFIVQKR